VRAICAAWERGDFSSAAWAHAEIEWVLPDGVQPGSSTGVAGMAQGWREFVTAWEEYRLDVEDPGNRYISCRTRRAGRSPNRQETV
jgi:hypothetical protein